MKNLDRILELLQDSNWHGVEEINNELHLSVDRLNEAIRFLLEWGLIEKEEETLKITVDGLEYLELQF
ncbi:MAG: hypothetical protein O8C66_07525 [Candidatus Methanoperedens sp.]|nr:hypothetical protein [Candidatus Methanoperedens sp.]MCZ7370344.1 hypothetical protein [Candidatus Methanoperedens sp.]